MGCKVTFEIDGKKYIREVDSGSGHSSQSSKILYFGLGKEKTIRNVTIHWGRDMTTIIKKINSGNVYTIRTNGSFTKLY